LDSTLVHTVLGFDLQLDPNDLITQLLVKDKIFEAPESELVAGLVRPDDICIDAGCHVGYYSCLLAKLVGEGGRVYSFDANPRACEITRSNLAFNNMHWVEVVHVALADRHGEAQFHVSTDDQTGLSSLGPIAAHQEIITVPCMRLDDFLEQRMLEHIRLLKVDVEGSEDIVLRGLGNFLTNHQVDFILAECYDKRLQLMNTSTEQVWAFLRSAGYIAWAYEESRGWAATTDVRSRGDCNYLFASSSVDGPVHKVSGLKRLLARLIKR
jgi:FkbM family methyltransferase